MFIMQANIWPKCNFISFFFMKAYNQSASLSYEKHCLLFLHSLEQIGFPPMYASIFKNIQRILISLH